MAIDPGVGKAATLFKALSSEARLSIVQRLIQAPACVHEMVDDVGLSQPLVSQHLRVLRSLDLVRGTRRGKEIVYALADDHVGHIVTDALAHGVETPARPLEIHEQPDHEMEHTP
ncbi:MAG: metalloregulator ArsR/SmtB family transcription factor [Ornithinimicrobium sp.]